MSIGPNFVDSLTYWNFSPPVSVIDQKVWISLPRPSECRHSFPSRNASAFGTGPTLQSNPMKFGMSLRATHDTPA